MTRVAALCATFARRQGIALVERGRSGSRVIGRAADGRRSLTFRPRENADRRRGRVARRHRAPAMTDVTRDADRVPHI